MYVPGPNTLDNDAARALVAEVGSAWLVTNGQHGEPPAATLLPILWRDDTVIAHCAKANPHWRTISEGSPGVFIVTGPEAYVSPSWYPSKHDHGRAAPTWNYLAVHLTGALRVHHDVDWLRAAVTDLTDRHESHRDDRWRVSDAPEDYVAKMLRNIAGIEMQVERVDAKAKLSQNRSEADIAGVIDGLRSESAHDAGRRIAELMANLPARP